MRTTMVLVAGAGIALFALTVVQARQAGGSAAPRAGAASRGVPRVSAEGRVVAYPGAEVQVSAEAAGRLVRLTVVEGQAVARGALLAEVDADELKAALREARARVGEAEAELRLAETTRTRTARLVEEQIAPAHDLDLSERDVETSAARLETAHAAVARLEAQIAKTWVRAPIGGTVVTRHRDPGETVQVGDALVTLADLSRLRVEGEADEADARALVVGSPVEIVADGYPGRPFRGSIEEVADSVTLRRLKPQDPARPTDTRILTVKVAFNERTPLKLGTTVELRVASR